MGLECFFGGHDYSRDCEVCSRCGKQRADAHDWSVPAQDPARHHCTRCGCYGPTVSELWMNCECAHCTYLRKADVQALIERVSSANGKVYDKVRYQGGVWRYTEDPKEADAALAVLVHRLEHSIGEIDDAVLTLAATLGLVFINVQYACDSPSVSEQVDCSQAIQLARQELVRRHGEIILDQLQPVPGIGTNAPLFGEPVARCETTVGIDLETGWAASVLPQMPTSARQPAALLRSDITTARIQGITGERPNFALCASGAGLYWRSEYGARLQYVDFASGECTVAYGEGHVGYFISLTDEKIALTVEHDSLAFCESGRPLDAVLKGAEPEALMNGLLWVKYDGKLVAVGHAGVVCALETPSTDSYIRWAHPSRNLLLLAHRSNDQRDPAPWYQRPVWYELVELDESLTDCHSQMILSESDDLEFGNFALGRDDELYYVELPKTNESADASNGVLHCVNLKSMTREVVVEERQSVTGLHGSADGRLLWVDRSGVDGATLIHFDPATGSRRRVLELPSGLGTVEVDERWTRLVYCRDSELYNAALA